MVRVLIVGREPVGARMAGPAIRCYEIANALSGEFDVTLAVPAPSDLPATRFRVATYRHDAPGTLASLASEMDAVLLSGYLLADFPELSRTGCPLIVDVYDPFPVENLGLHRRLSLAQRMAVSESDFRVLCDLLQAGDFFLCGSEQQRHFWLGMLAACGRLNPLTREADPTFRALVDVVSMGIPAEPPMADGLLKGSFRGIDPGDFLLVWPGGLWDWLDPLTAVEAIRLLACQAPEVKLLFPGVRHPNPDRIGAMETSEAVLSRSRELGLLGARIFYCDWTPYGERARYLLDADVALSLHPGGVESDLAMRARLLDCVWAGTPVISTRGDAIAEALAKGGMAKLVPPRDPAAVAEAILNWRAERDSKARLAESFRGLSAEYHWSRVCRPLVQFLQRPHPAADHFGDLSEGRVTAMGQYAIEVTHDDHEPPVQFSPTRDMRQVPGGGGATLTGALARLREQEAELGAARELLYRIERGKLMRLINGYHSFMRKLTR